MADPLSIASGIAGLLSLGIQVTQGLVKFYATYKDKDTDLAKITRNLESLLSVFRALDIAVKERQSQADTQDLLREVEKAVQDCEETITELQSECEKFHRDSAASFKDRVKVAGRRAAYPFRKSTLQKLEEDVSDIRENLSFALDVLQLKSHTQVEDGILEIKSLVERTNASQVSFTIRCWLGAPDASVNHNATCAKCHPSTGLWFVNGHPFRTWLEDRNSFLWLNGFAGCGKSVLCSTAIQHTFRDMRQKHDVGIAFFYFSFTDEAKQDDNSMLRALLLQLSGQLPDGERYLEQLHVLHKSGSPPVHALLDCLQSYLRRFRDTYILLDALDESPPDCKREHVLRAIQVMRDWSIPCLHLLVTSRNLGDIRESLRPSYNEDLPLRNSEIDKDIANFVTYQLENDAKLQKWKQRHHEIEVKLTVGAQGVFRYVECQFNALRRAKTRNQLDECLRALPRDLDETYERILCSIDSDYVKDVRRVLTVLYYSRRPVTVDELIDAHAVDLSDPPRLDRDGRSYEQHDLIDICLGLIEIAAAIDDKGHPTLIVRIAHFSVQEYLQSYRILQQNARMFAMQSETGNREMALICLIYLMEPALSMESLDETKLMLFPFARFAATHWLRHYANSGEGKKTVEPLALRLFKEDMMAFATWIRLHDVDCRWQGDVDYDRPITDIASPFYYAALLGLEFILSSILPMDTGDSRGSEIVNAQGGQLGTALQAASLRGHKNVVQMLLDRGADINAQGGVYGSALQAASYGGHEDVVKMLLDRGAAVNAQGGRPGNALQAASLEGHEKVIKMLLDRGADINAQGGVFGNTLAAASYRGHQNVVKTLLDRGADINAQGGVYGNALQAASLGGHENVVKMLLDRGADINAQSGEYGNALQAASREGHEIVIKMLLDRGADINAQGGWLDNALQAASYGGHEKVVQMLLDRGADINAQGGWLSNALHAASYGGYENVVQMLVYRGATLHVRDPTYGHTALSRAAEKGHDVIVKRFLSTNKGWANVRDNRGRTPLFYAAWRGHDAVATAILTDNSVGLDQKDHYGSTPLSIAVRHVHVNVVRVLLATEVVACDSHDRMGRSVLWWAKRSGNADVEKLLTDYARMRGISIRGAEHVDGRLIPRGKASKICDVCTLDVPWGNSYYHCRVCYGGDFDICFECYELGGRCLQESHGLNKGLD